MQELNSFLISLPICFFICDCDWATKLYILFCYFITQKTIIAEFNQNMPLFSNVDQFALLNWPAFIQEL